MAITVRLLIGFSCVFLLLPLIALAQTSSFNMQDCLTARGASSPPSLQDLQACSPRSSTIRSAPTASAPTTPAQVSSSCPNIARTLQKGSRGTEVTSLQNFLISQGHLESGNNTGYFGALTESAVQKFQCSQSIVCSGTPASTGYGLVGAKTRAAIQRSCSGTTTTNTTTTSNLSTNSSQSLIDQLNAQIKQLQERIVALSNAGSQSTQSTQTTQTTQSTQTTTSNASCTFNGQNIAHGQSVTAYQASSVASGQTCQSQTRACSNGTLSGNYAYGSCTVQTEGAAALTVTAYPAAGYVSVAFENAPGNPNDWIGIWDPVNQNYLDWVYTSGTKTAGKGWTNGSVEITANFVEGRTYYAYFHINNSSSGAAYDDFMGQAASSNTSSGSQTGSCQLPRKYTYTLSSDVNLSCDSSFDGRAVIFNPTISDEGFAIARATLKIRNNYSTPGGWGAQAYFPGGGGLYYDMADNIAPGDTKWKTVLGSGNILPGYNTVRVSGYNYGVNGTCSNGGFSVLAGSTLEVWVEDPAAQCKGKYVGLTSIYESGGEGVWGYDFPTITIPATSDASSILIMASIEGTLEYCTSGTLTAITSTNYHSLLGSAVSDTVPTEGYSSRSLCHLSLATSNTASYSPSVTQTWLHPRNYTNASVYSGYRSGGSYSGNSYGDAAIGFVKMQ